MSPQDKSRYAQKRESGQMMYGPGCCAHKLVITDEVRTRMRKRCDERDSADRQASETRAKRTSFNRLFGG